MKTFLTGLFILIVGAVFHGIGELLKFHLFGGEAGVVEQPQYFVELSCNGGKFLNLLLRQGIDSTAHGVEVFPYEAPAGER